LEYLMGSYRDARVLVIPIDMPRLSVAVCRLLLEAPGPAAHFRGHVFPLAVTLTERAVEAARKAFSVREIGSALSAAELDAPDEEQFVNVNTPNDLARLKA
jgi:molybdopterin-guanine dinucleotide biosynthesis protein A